MLVWVRSATTAASLHGPLLIDGLGIPRYWAAVWATFLPAELAPGTVEQNLRYVEGLYAYSDGLLGYGELDGILTRMDFEALDEVLGGYFQSLRNATQRISQSRWGVAVRFTSDILTRLGKSPSSPLRLADLQAKLARVELLHSALRVGARRRPEAIRSLPPEVVDALYHMLEPGSLRNPFRSGKSQWSVHVIHILLQHQGLRRGELLSLSADAIRSGFDKQLQRERHWMTVKNNEYEDDPRHSKPRLKTVNSWRQIPVSTKVVQTVDRYVENYRGRPNHSFLVSSQRKRPLSTERLTKIFNTISKSLPKSALRALHDQKGEESISPHDLRHTCAVFRLNQLLSHGVPMEEALQQLSHTSQESTTKGGARERKFSAAMRV